MVMIIPPLHFASGKYTAEKKTQHDVNRDLNPGRAQDCWAPFLHF